MEITTQWITSESADEENHDQEMIFDDGWHVCVSPNGDGWHWAVWDQWLHSDNDGLRYPLIEGQVPDENTAKEAGLDAYREARNLTDDDQEGMV